MSWLKAGVALVCLVLAAGCETPETDKKKMASFMRLHLEANIDGTRHSTVIPIYRAQPIGISIATTAVLDEGFMKTAEVVDVDESGGFAIKITFNEEGARRWDYVTSSNKGRRIAVLARWTEDRWLAAPLLTKRIVDGVFIFTPDATREEADRIVLGLQNTIKKVSGPWVF